MKIATLRLFNAIHVQDKKDLTSTDYVKYIAKGFLVHPSIPLTESNIKMIDDTVSLNKEKLNASFHKSWAVVQNSSLEKLVMQQCMHYFTTYGFESMGIFDESTVYVPAEKLEIPELTENIELITINALDKKEVLEKLLVLGSGVALKDTTIADMMTIIKGNVYPKSFVKKMKNRELLAKLYEFYGIVPSEPVEFLRHTINKLTDSTLIIKNGKLISEIKESDGTKLDKLMKKAPKDLSSIFLRYKPLFLAMKSISRDKGFYNKLRKDAIRTHKPLPMDYLNSVTALIKTGKLDLKVLYKKLKTVPIFRKIRLINSLKYRMLGPDTILYKIRSGKGWAGDMKWPKELNEMTEKTIKIVMKSIGNDLKANVDGKTIYIPKYINYTVPATEKQFTGMFPSGTSVGFPGNMMIGINWKNNPGYRVDLDFSLIDVKGKTGWNGLYRRDDTLFSGDETSAPGENGASETFLFKTPVDCVKMVNVNYFNFSSDEPNEYTFYIAGTDKVKIERNYMVDKNDLLATANLVMDKKSSVLGIVVNDGGENRLYFSESSISNTISSSKNNSSDKARDYFVNSSLSAVSLNEVLAEAGAIIVTEVPTEEDAEFIDLSPKNLAKDSILKLMVSNK